MRTEEEAKEAGDTVAELVSSEAASFSAELRWKKEQGKWLVIKMPIIIYNQGSGSVLRIRLPWMHAELKGK